MIWWLMVKKIRKFWLIILWFVSFIFVWNFTQAKDYEYTNLDIKADVKIDGTIDVTETFTANFLKKKHWIIRFIPFDYEVWGDYFHIDLSFIRVDWNNFSTYIDDGGMNIKIWDPDIEIKWEKVYPISYSVYWLIRNFAWMWYHELYWNLVWDDFDTNINKIKAEINLPKIYTWFTNEDFLITTDWNTRLVNDFQWKIDWSKWDKIIITYNQKLEAWDGITLAIKFPNDYFEFDHDKQAGLIWKFSNSSDDSESGRSTKLFDSFASFFSYIVDFVWGVVVFFVVMLFAMLLDKLWLISSDHIDDVTYDRHKWFSRWSVFSWWWKFFKKWGWGGWWGSRSW